MRALEDEIEETSIRGEYAQVEPLLAKLRIWEGELQKLFDQLDQL